MSNYLLDVHKVDYRLPQSQLQSGWFVPNIIKLQNGYLIYPPAYSAFLNPTSIVMEKIFDRFLSLYETKDDGKILEFAQKFGVLGIGDKTAYTDDWKPIEIEPMKYEEAFGQEPLVESLSDWRWYSKLASTILKLSNELRQNKIDAKDWKAFAGWVPDKESARHQISLSINKWIVAAGLRPRFIWEDKPSIRLVSDSNETKLLAVLCVQLILMVNQSPGLDFCSGCGAPFILRKGQPRRSNRNTYCGECGRNAGVKKAVQKYRQKNKKNPSRRKKSRQTLTDALAIEIRRECETQKRAMERVGQNDSLKDGKRLVYPKDFIHRLASSHDVSIDTIYKIANDVLWKKRAKAIQNRQQNISK